MIIPVPDGPGSRQRALVDRLVRQVPAPFSDGYASTPPDALAVLEQRVRRIEEELFRRRIPVSNVILQSIEDDGPCEKPELVQRVIGLRPGTSTSTVYREMQKMLAANRLLEDAEQVVHDRKTYEGAG